MGTSNWFTDAIDVRRGSSDEGDDEADSCCQQSWDHQHAEPTDIEAVIGRSYPLAERFLLWHYQFGSKYDSPFWEYAKSLPFEMDMDFKWNVDYAKSHDLKYLNENPRFYSQWNSYNIRNWLDNVAT